MDSKLDSMRIDIENQLNNINNQVHQSLDNQLQRLKFEMKDELVKEVEKRAASMKG